MQEETYMKKCPVCGLMLPNEAMRCTICNTVQEVNLPQEQLEAIQAAESIDPLEAEMEAFFNDQEGDNPSPFAPRS